MRLSLNIPNFGALPATLGLRTMAREAEAAGAAGIWLADHLLLVDEPITDYPYTTDGSFPLPATLPFFESLTSCAYLAAATEHCRIGIGVLVLPQRNPLELAKMAATIDQLSGGRFALGVGSGWNRLEIEALGYSFATRGRRTDEMLRLLRSCWDGAPQAFEGEQLTLRDRIKLYPTPVQQGVPLLIGGMTNVALRRAAASGDGWLAIAHVARLDPDVLHGRIAELGALRTAFAPKPFELILKLHAEPALAPALPEAVARVADLGFDETIIDVPWELGVDRACAVFEACAESLASVTSPGD